MSLGYLSDIHLDVSTYNLFSVSFQICISSHIFPPLSLLYTSTFGFTFFSFSSVTSSAMIFYSYLIESFHTTFLFRVLNFFPAKCISLSGDKCSTSSSLSSLVLIHIIKSWSKLMFYPLIGYPEDPY